MLVLRGRRRRRHGGDPGRARARRARGRGGRLAREARALPRARRRGGVRLRRAAGRPAGRRRRRSGRRRAVRRPPSRDCVRSASSSRSAPRAGCGPSSQPAHLVGRNVGVQGFYLGRLLRLAPDVVAARDGELLELWQLAPDPAARRRRVPAREVEQRARARRVAPQRREGRARPVRALVTGGRGGIGARDRGARSATPRSPSSTCRSSTSAIRTRGGRSRASSTPRFSTRASARATRDAAELTDDEWQRILRANLDGVVYGTRELAARLMPNGGSIVATASLAGLTGMPHDPVYTRDEARRRRLRAQRRAALAARGIRHQRALPRLHRHAARRGGAARR